MRMAGDTSQAKQQRSLLRGRAIVTCVFMLSGMASAQPAQTDLGAYLAARAAIDASDFDAAAAYFGQALEADATNPNILDEALTAEWSAGHVQAAKRR